MAEQDIAKHPTWYQRTADPDIYWYTGPSLLADEELESSPPNSPQESTIEIQPLFKPTLSDLDLTALFGGISFVSSSVLVPTQGSTIAYHSGDPTPPVSLAADVQLEDNTLLENVNLKYLPELE